MPMKIFLNFVIVFFVDLIIPMSADPRYIPDIDITINCGFSGGSKSLDGREWIGDMDSKFTPTENPGGEAPRSSRAVSQKGSVSEVPYMTARFSSSEFTYSLPVSPGPKFIRLYFYPASYSGFNGVSSFFTVKVGPFTLLKNFSASLKAMFLERESFTREYIINVEDRVQKLNISFIPSPDSYVFINGIEVVSMPADLYYSPEGLGARYIGQTSMYNVQYDKGLETFYRLNVGGPFIPAINDTGMFRTWSPGYVKTKTFIQSNDSIEITFNRNTPNYTAPDEIYMTAVTMRSDPDENLKGNVTLNFTVDSGFMYLVRLHFCEFKTILNKTNQRVFTVYINQQTDNVMVDVFDLSGRRLGSPVCKDYVVIIGDMGIMDEADLRIDFHPVNSFYVNAIINAVEIFKMSFENSLAGPNRNLKLELSPPPARPSSSVKKLSVTKLILIGLGVCSSLVCSIFFVGYIFLWRMRKRKQFLEGRSSMTTASSLPDERCRRFSLAEILEATNGFDRNLIVGVGGFGDVYRGYFEKKKMTIAVKRLNPESRQGNPEFKTEIEFLSELRHTHLVSLIGYCIEEEEKLLIYEYMENGTLREHLYGSNKDPLPWIKRLEICIGAARGLNYLHSGGAGQPIIHRDVKTTNILLDDKWVAKVSDFGLSKMGRVDSAVSTMVKGTWGYLDPEYLRKNQVSEKADVYSFGVVLFEVLCSRKPLDQKLEDPAQCNLAEWAKRCIDNGVLHQIIDSRLIGKIAPKCFKKFVEIAGKCIRGKITNRPSMNDVVEQLQFVLQLQIDADADAAKQEIAAGEECVYPELRYRVPSSKTESQKDDIDEEESAASEDSEVEFSSTRVGS